LKTDCGVGVVVGLEVGAEEGAGGQGVVVGVGLPLSAVGDQGVEAAEGGVEHAGDALLGLGEAFEGVVGVGALVGLGEEEAGRDVVGVEALAEEGGSWVTSCLAWYFWAFSWYAMRQLRWRPASACWSRSRRHMREQTRSARKSSAVVWGLRPASMDRRRMRKRFLSSSGQTRFAAEGAVGRGVLAAGELALEGFGAGGVLGVGAVGVELGF
jgi:hypothetical protein